ncbi:SMP-30/gluconolactonase/LRE family protein [Streptomyces sp. NPDC051776]|uniref:SMP-30/gluconolactonase/LRE family protein n=1 Tax=Streptomyces sp. NPDC051776 TaxID=3155414 RepID=UPI0034146E2F
MSGRYERGRERPLPSPHVIAPDADGPEDVQVDSSGRVLAGLADGRIVRLTLNAAGGLDRYEVLARTGGRPLGLEVAADGGLLVCDARRGLLRVDPQAGSVRALVEEVDGLPLRFCSNVAAARDGTVYFTVSSRRYGLEGWLGDILEHTGSGLLARLRPGGEPEVLLGGLQFANGVALAPDETFVVVAETGAYRLTRFWLSGPEAGRSDTFLGGLPGFPDNMSRTDEGLFWIALAGPRDAAVDWLSRRSGTARRVAGAAGAMVTGLRAVARPRPTVRVLAVDSESRIVHDLVLHRSPYRMVTSVCAFRGGLVLGSLYERGIAVCDRLPAG